MIRIPDWVKLPNRWIEDTGLRQFRWVRGEGANNLAALMALTVIAHHVDPDTGVARLTYGDIQKKAMLSRAKISAGLDVLAARKIIVREPEGRSSLGLADYDPKIGWTKFPANGLYRNGSIAAFADFRLRLPAELDAMKLYFLFASRRDRATNLAKISYDKIDEYAGVGRNSIKRGLSLLAANGLVYVEHFSSSISEHGVASAYRLAHLDSRRHMGTTGRGADEFDLVDQQ